MATAAPFAIPAVLKALRARLLGAERLARVAMFTEAVITSAPTSGEYVTIGPLTEVPANTLGAGWGSNLTATIKVVSYSRDVAPGYALVKAIVAALHGQALAVEGYSTGWAELELVVDAYSELVAGVPVTHFPVIIRVHVSEAA